MLDSIIKNNRRLRIEHQTILKECNNSDLDMFEILKNYLNDYSAFYQLSPEAVEHKYIVFIDQYIKDFKVYLETDKYPYQVGTNVQFDRITYDLALILSVFFTPVRFQIFKSTLESIKVSDGKILIIGLGAAMELELIAKLFPHKQVDTYDITISEFVKSRFSKSILHEKEFKFDENNKYDLLLIIELLEHLTQPYLFIKNCALSLNNLGTLVCTTASNMPQFDHLYNFHDDDFEIKIASLFSVQKQIELKHKLMNPNIHSYNTFYQLNKLG